jgi:hypothetical protein
LIFPVNHESYRAEGYDAAQNDAPKLTSSGTGQYRRSNEVSDSGEKCIHGDFQQFTDLLPIPTLFNTKDIELTYLHALYAIHNTQFRMIEGMLCECNVNVDVVFHVQVDSWSQSFSDPDPAMLYAIYHLLVICTL